MPTDLIRYDLLVQDALRSVVRRVLTEASREGLPGEHHFYVTFRTAAPGVRLSARMRERYPDEMTIVLQHQFWDLTVTEANFEVGLSFNNIPEMVLVPFDAITQFGDPSVGFALKFEMQEPELEGGANDTDVPASAKRPAGEASLLAKRSQDDRSRQDERQARSAAPDGKAEALFRRNDESGRSSSQDQSALEAAESELKGSEAAPNVVSIDAFRKKT
ncbi:MAG: hypothetical protein EBY21_01910 [Alphaproteobacteria bacterium]|nr:hypothetical protein [Alphaproteobacteria bacterium]